MHDDVHMHGPYVSIPSHHCPLVAPGVYLMHVYDKTEQKDNGEPVSIEALWSFIGIKYVNMTLY